jgi:hypothetical protein
MSNAPVRAAAEGMPRSTRRAFITSAAAVAVAAPATIASATPATGDPVFAAIAAWKEADAAWLAKVDLFGAAEEACSAENAIAVARLDIEICGVPFRFSSDEEISYFLRTLPNRGASATENAERLAQAGERFRADLAAERERVASVRSKHNVDVLEAQMEAASSVAQKAAGRIVATIPTTLAGVRALAEFLAVPDRLYVGQDETGLASLAAACRALLPAA